MYMQRLLLIPVFILAACLLVAADRTDLPDGNMASAVFAVH